jgi:hypothetical protein
VMVLDKWTMGDGTFEEVPGQIAESGAQGA